MSRIRATSPTPTTNAGSGARKETDKLDPAPEANSRPRHIQDLISKPSIAADIFDLAALRLATQPQMDRPAADAGSTWSALDLDLLGRSLIVLPAQPGDRPGTRCGPPAIRLPAVHRELEIQCLEATSASAPAPHAAAPQARTELEDHFSGIDSEPAPRRGLSRWLLGMLGSAWSFWQRQRTIRRSVAALSEMSDRELRDIGIYHRLQIPELVRHGR